MKCPGYILLWRQFMDTSFYKDSCAFHLAVHLIFKANHADNEIIFNKTNLIIKRGQHVTGRHQLAKELGLPGGTIRNKLKLLQNIGFLDIKTTNKFSIVTICNYEHYQNIKTRNGQHLGQREDNKRTARGQQEDTPKELIIHDNTLIKKDELKGWIQSFTVFYSAYPKHTGKKKALEVWLKLKPSEELLQTILKGIEVQKRSNQWQKNNGEFIPYPATWLNGRRWEDEACDIKQETIWPTEVVL